ncbi:SigE family RNA polymerase sigma factor [Streptomyces sp. NPDC088180]|uniref:SigE family RNA polymerase sigma factor n=1 Tax=Streptomyces sp. NPDC088180 TaxID=3365837 RepID=UPI0038245DDC
MAEDRNAELAAPARQAVAAAGGLRLLVERMGDLGWRMQDYRDEDLLNVASALRGTAILIALDTEDMDLHEEATGCTRCTMSPSGSESTAKATVGRYPADPGRLSRPPGMTRRTGSAGANSPRPRAASRPPARDAGPRPHPGRQRREVLGHPSVPAVIHVTAGGSVQHPAPFRRHGGSDRDGTRRGGRRVRFRRSGPGNGFTEFVAQRSGALFRTAYALTGDVHVAEDLVQEALERACRHWRKVEVADSPEAYVRKVLVNLANDRWRRLSRLGERPGLSGAPERADPRDRFGQVDLRAELIEALLGLPMGMRSVVVLYYLHDLDARQVAGVLDISSSAVRSQLARGLAKLRDSVSGAQAPHTPTAAFGGTK